MDIVPDSQSILEFRHDTSRHLLIAFTGWQRRRVPDFHWLRAIENQPVNKLAVRDLRQMFYQKGIPEAGNNAESVGVFLQNYIAQHAFEGTIFVGGSMGAYAAILYGWLTGADEVHAFASLTRLPARTRMDMLKLIVFHNWGLLRVNGHMYLNPTLERTYFDLKSVLAQDNGRTKYHLYYGTGHKRDAIHSERMADLPGVTLHPYDSAAHHLSTEIRDSGEMAHILNDARQRLENNAPQAFPSLIP